MIAAAIRDCSCENRFGNWNSQGMAQIIDIEERRKPRTLPRSRAEALKDPTILDAAAYVDQLMAPIAFWWQSWFSSWGSLCLAPLGLQVLPVQSSRQPASKNRSGPRG